MTTLLSKYLKALHVPHTSSFADTCFSQMTFKTLFGLQRALEEFGVHSRGLEFADPANALDMPTPFLAQVHGEVLIVDSIKGTPGERCIVCQSIHGQKTFCEQGFLEVFTGIVLQSRPQPGAREKELGIHRFQQFANTVKIPVLVIMLLLLAIYGSIEAGIWHNVWSSLVFLFYTAGVGVCYLLWLKTNGVKSKVADSMCSLTTKHGCDKVLDTRLASFMGIFKWSEVGMGYFAVSLLTLVIFPGQWSNLALLNACCLPYTVWSILSQKFIIHAWCTLCLTVQSLLWALFIAFLLGGAWQSVSVSLSTFVLLGCYVCGVLLMNLVNMFINKAKVS